MKAVTWSKDSHGLFDYEFSQYTMKKLHSNKSVKVYRTRDEVTSVNEDVDEEALQTLRDEGEFLLSIKKQEADNIGGTDRYFINPQLDIQRTNIYLIVRSLKAEDCRSQRGYELHKGDVIKLGRVEYRIVELNNGQSIENERDDTNNDSCLNYANKEFDIDNQEIPPNTEMICRYCLHDTCNSNDPDSIDNALIFCCQCVGSSGGVHYQCLKSWIKNKIITKSNYSTLTYQLKKLQCEVCKSPLPRKVKYQGKIHELVSIERPSGPYIIAEKINGPNEPELGPTFSVIIPNDTDPVRLGRGHQCDLRISDISVSRIHALLWFKDNKFLIFDNESKFGTLIHLSNPYEIKSDKAAIQIGRTVFTLVTKNGPAAVNYDQQPAIN